MAERNPKDCTNDKARQFFAAAEPLLHRYGFKKTTVEEICRAAGASKRTFYELFRDKGDLLMQMLHCLVSDGIARWRQSMDPSMTAVDKLERYLKGYEAFGRAHPVFQECMHEADLFGPGEPGCPHEGLQVTMDALREVIDEGMASGEFRAMDPEAAVYVIDGLLDSMYYVYPKMTGEKSALDDPVLAREVHDFIINGLRSPDRPGAPN